jgi:hypothetical protein
VLLLRCHVAAGQPDPPSTPVSGGVGKRGGEAGAGRPCQPAIYPGRGGVAGRQEGWCCGVAGNIDHPAFCRSALLHPSP